MTFYSASSLQAYTGKIEFFDNTRMLGKVSSIPVSSPFPLKVDVDMWSNLQESALKTLQ